VHWPESSLNGDFKITVVGNSKVTQELTALVQNKTVLGKKIVVSQVNTAQELTGAHLVYLSGGRSGDLEELLQKLAGKPVLVVTERDGLGPQKAPASVLREPRRQLPAFYPQRQASTTSRLPRN
jgi:hypothetical protein